MPGAPPYDRALIDLLPQVIWTLSPDSECLSVNSRWSEYTGLTAGVSAGGGWAAALHPDDAHELALALKCGRDAAFDFRLRRDDSVFRQHRVYMAPAHDAAGRIWHWVCTAVDIQDQRAAEEAMRRYKEIFERTDQGLAVTSGDGMALTLMNPAFAHLHGYAAGELVGWPASALVAPALRAAFASDVSRANASGRHAFETRNVRRDGLSFPAQVTITAVRDSQGQTLYHLLSVTDITERQAAQNQLSVAYDGLATAYMRERLLNEVAAAMRDASSPERVQTVAVSALAEALNADRCYFSFYRAEQDKVWLGPEWHSPDLPGVAGHYSLSALQADLNACFPQRTAIAIDDVRKKDISPPLRALYDRLRVRSGIRMPLYEGDHLVATLTVAMSDTTRHWKQHEVALVEAVALQARAAVDAARARSHEREVSAVLQEALRPSAPAAIPGLDIATYYQPALAEASIGGDFHDIFAIGGDRYALVVGDVSGKGAIAAAQVTTVRNILRCLLYQGRPPADALRELNAMVTAHDLLIGFVTLFVSIYDPADGALSYASAGHETALVRRAGQPHLEELPATAPPVGIDERTRFVQGDIALAPGDAVLVHTDGVTEAGPNRSKLLGTSGISRLFQSSGGVDAREVADGILQGVFAYAQGEMRDDTCLVLAIRK